MSTNWVRVTTTTTNTTNFKIEVTPITKNCGGTMLTSLVPFSFKPRKYDNYVIHNEGNGHCE